MNRKRIPLIVLTVTLAVTSSALAYAAKRYHDTSRAATRDACSRDGYVVVLDTKMKCTFKDVL